MSFKDELDKRRKASAEEQAKKEADRKQHLAVIEARAMELETHLNEQDVASIALKLEREGDQIVLKQARYQIVIDPRVNEYVISMQAPTKKKPFEFDDDNRVKTSRKFGASGSVHSRFCSGTRR